jgi:hypothetical protein
MKGSSSNGNGSPGGGPSGVQLPKSTSGSSPITTRFSPRLTSTTSGGMAPIPPLPTSNGSPNGSPAGRSPLLVKPPAISTAHGRKPSESSPLLPKAAKPETAAAKKAKIMTALYCAALLITAVYLLYHISVHANEFDLYTYDWV